VRVRFPACLLALCVSLPALADTEKPSRAELEALLAKTDEIAATVIKMRGLPLKKPLARGLMSRDEILKRVTLLMDQEYAPGELVAEERTLKRLGLVPKDADLRKMFLELLVEQIAGFYDPGAKQLYLADWIPVSMQRVVVAHEIVHALQDQHFDLDKYGKLPRAQADALLARKAVAEGDGVALMIEFAVAEMNPNMDPWADDRLIDMISSMTMGSSELQALKNAPLVLKESLLFPYESGLRFIAKMRRTRPWSEVDKLFRDPPTSTEQILHPEKYDRRENPIAIKLPAQLASFKGWKRIYLGDQGEMGFRIVFRQHGIAKERAERAAAGWGGDQLQVFAPASDDGASVDDLVVVNPTVWDAEMDAIEAYDAMVQILPALGGGEYGDKPAADRATVRAPNGTVTMVSRKGNRVLLVIGAPGDLLVKLEKELATKWR
jgi:hypothetical protein